MGWIKGPTPVCHCARTELQGGSKPTTSKGGHGDQWQCDECKTVWEIIGAPLVGLRWVRQ